MESLPNLRICPKCNRASDVVPKLLLIGIASPTSLISNFEELAGYQRRDQLAVDECMPDALRTTPLQQFIDGYFCTKCGVGFVPDEIAIRKAATSK